MIRFSFLDLTRSMPTTSKVESNIRVCRRLPVQDWAGPAGDREQEAHSHHLLLLTLLLGASEELTAKVMRFPMIQLFDFSVGRIAGHTQDIECHLNYKN